MREPLIRQLPLSIRNETTESEITDNDAVVNLCGWPVCHFWNSDAPLSSAAQVRGSPA